jgi:hypothetical protein
MQPCAGTPQKKHRRDPVGSIKYNKTSSFSEPVLGSRTSPYLQSKLVLLGCEHVFGQVPALVESLLGVEVSQSQVYRTCQRAAFVADEGVLDEPSAGLGEHLWDEQQTVYGMADGSMLLTDQGWQEVKVGRVFEAHPSPEARLSATHAAESGLEQFRWQVSGSEYVASRGNYEEFTRKFEQLFPADALCRQVFISDGALGQGKCFLRYPRATHILTTII